jgi:hypothetical protein
MTATVTELGARVLRRLGVAAVAASDRPAVAATTTVADVAARALQRLAVTVPEVDRPVIATTVTVANVAVRALQALGIPAPTSEWPALSGSVTVAEIGLDALQRLGVVAGDETAATADQALASAQVTAVHDQLVQQGVISWSSSAIPRQVALDYAIMAMRQLAPSFGTPAVEVQMLVPQADAAEARLRKQAAVVRAQSFAESQAAATHAHLVGAGIASWTSSAIPQAVSDEYVELVRQEVAAVLGEQLQGVPDKQVLHERVRRAAHVMRAQSDAATTVAAVHDGLVRRGLVSWASSAIPAGLREPLSALTAIELASSFGIETDRSAVAEYEAQVRQVALLIGGPAIAERAVRQVHDDLAARGKTRWGWSDLPPAAERPYVVLAANSIAYEFQVPPDQLGGAQAVVDLARLISLPSSGERVVAEYF